MQTPLRRRLLASTILIGATLVATPAFAQEQATVDQAQASEKDTIIITGSRIARPDIENSTPTLVVGQEQLQARGFTNIADLATQLPQFTPSFGASRTQSTFSGAATSGLNLINLRNLGGGRTLTLINGRRAPGGTTTGTAVDFNTIPTANIERIEVVTGGASAVYGADAVAGVVNIITRKNFNGFEAGALTNISESGDNESYGGYVMYGGQLGDRGRVNVTVQLDRQGLVNCSDRSFCSDDFAWFPPSSPVFGPAARSAVGVNGTFFLTAGNGLPAINATRIGDSFTDASGSLIPFSVTRDGFNRNGVRDLAQPTTRVLFAADVEYDVTDGITSFVEFNYGRSETDAAFEGHPFQSSAAGSLFGGGPGVAGLQASIPIDNPFIPAAIRNAAVARGQTVIQWQQRFSAFDDRGAVNERQMFRLVGGFRGEITDKLNFEVSHVHGQTKLDSLTSGLVSTRNLYYGLRVEPDPARPGQFRCADPGARASGCLPINPFAPYTQEMKNALNVTAGQSGRSVLNDFNAFVSGSLFALPAGDVGFAAGVETRSFSGFLDYDTPINRAEVTGNQIGDVDRAKISTREIFGEAIVPVLKDMSFAKALTLEGAYRYTDQKNGSNYSTWRYGGTWEPVDGVRFRAVRARAVRAPTPGELSGVGQSFGVVNDPCIAASRNANPTRATNCTADGVPATYNPPLNVLQSVGGFVGGNPNVSPEKATTLTYGVAITPAFIPGFSLTVDRFEIRLNDIINTVGRQLKANQCYDTTARLFCEDVIRGTNPNVPGANYVLTSVNDQLINVASTRINGWDIEARYATELLGGKLDLQFVGTIYDKAKYTPLPGQTPTDLLGFAGGSTSDQGFIKFTGFLNVNYRIDQFTINYNNRYIGQARTSPFATGATRDVVIGDRSYSNLRLAWDATEKFQVYFGVNNLLDVKPPLFPSGTSGTQALDVIPGYYDIFGRSYFTGVRVRM